MLAKLYTATLIGLDCKIVEVEVDYRKGQTYFSVVGLADKSIQEARDRIPPAIRNSGGEFVPMKIIMNLAPAEIHKSGPSFDFPLALSYLKATNQVSFNSEKKLFIGELSLDGRLRPVNGILPITDNIKKLGFEEIYLPFENAIEASLVKDIKIYPVKSLKEVIAHFNGVEIEPYTVQHDFTEDVVKPKFDLSEVKGQSHAKRALEIAAAGGHNILMSGTPGSGKTMLSKCLPGILPKMAFDESIEVTRIYSVAGLLSDKKPLVLTRPFRSPHHTSSQVALVGGGSSIKPGEISLAHRGVLFLDEFPEFSPAALEALRQPLEDKVITISRAVGSLTFPANFILVAAMNPCKCGYRGDSTKECICSTMDLAKYKRKVSGPILDRIDLLINVFKVENENLFSNVKSESSSVVAERVQAARNVQIERLKELNLYSNSEMAQAELEKFVKLNETSKSILKMAVDRMNISARSYYRLLKVARTIADLEKSEQVKEEHITEALTYRVEIN